MGIASAIWSFVPIFVAIIERLFYHVEIKLNQVVGMVLLVLMSILVALSDLFGEEAEVVKINEITE